jgi:hypothetical protein
MNSICLGLCSLYMQPIFKKCPFKENGKPSKLFCLVLRGLILPAGSDTHRTKSCGVSGTTEQDPAGYQTPQNYSKSCGVSDSAEQWQSCVLFIAYTCSAGSDTPQNNVLRGLKPSLTKFCGVSDSAEQSPAGYQNPAEQHSKTNISANSKKNSKIF